MRRLLLLVSTLVLVDVVFYSAIAPLLPGYVADFSLTRAEAGVLTASYATGTLLASLPSGLLASRVGARPTVIGGLAMLGVSSVVFGFADNVALLDASRFCQGIASALIWSGAMTWLIAASPPDRRGSVIGTAVGTAVVGALIGPVLGALAAEVGTRLVFSGVLAVTAALAVFAARTPESASPERRELNEVAAVILSRPLLLSVAFVAIPSAMFGTVEVLVPLHVADLGGGHVVIAAGFIAGAAIEAGLAPLAGRYSDRVGRAAPLAAGLLVAAVGMLTIGFGAAVAVVIGGLLVGSAGGGICFTPAWTLLSETAEANQLHQGFAAGLSNMAWAAGQMVGGIAGGGIASVAGYGAPSLAVAVLLVSTAAYARVGLSSSGDPEAVG